MVHDQPFNKKYLKSGAWFGRLGGDWLQEAMPMTTTGSDFEVTCIDLKCNVSKGK